MTAKTSSPQTCSSPCNRATRQPSSWSTSDPHTTTRAPCRSPDETPPADRTLVLAWQKQRRPNGRLFRLTRPVEALLRYLEAHPAISLSEFCRLAHIRRPIARHILSDLLALGTLRYTILPDGRLVYIRADGGE